MVENKVAKRAWKLGFKYDKNEWHISPISDLYYNIQNAIKFLSLCDKKKDCTGAQLSEVKKNISVIEKAVNEIKTDPELQKFAKRHKGFLQIVIKEKDTIFASLEKKYFPGKSIEIGIANKFIEEMKALKPEIDTNYRFLKINLEHVSLAGLQDIHFEQDDYRLLSGLKKANDLNKNVSQLTTTDQFEQELDTLKKQASGIYDEISEIVVKDYDELKTLDAKLQEERPEYKKYYPVIRNDIEEELERL